MLLLAVPCRAGESKGGSEEVDVSGMTIILSWLATCFEVIDLDLGLGYALLTSLWQRQAIPGWNIADPGVVADSSRVSLHVSFVQKG